jgi:organic radical activating enzyme
MNIPESKKEEILSQLEFEITHLCNQYCPLCDHRISTSSYKNLTKDDYNYIVNCITDREKIKSILLIGGEPLLHPHFEWLVNRMRNDFPGASFTLATNGTLLNRLSDEMFKIFSAVRISYYPEFNDEIVEEYRKFPNVYIQNGMPMNNPYVDLNISDDISKNIYQKHLQVRIVGKKMYTCCIAEGIERHYQTEKVHEEFDEDWRSKFFKIPTWKACKHCYKANMDGTC